MYIYTGCWLNNYFFSHVPFGVMVIMPACCDLFTMTEQVRVTGSIPAQCRTGSDFERCCSLSGSIYGYLLLRKTYTNLWILMMGAHPGVVQCPRVGRGVSLGLLQSP
jgi:hypothetical protein